MYNAETATRQEHRADFNKYRDRITHAEDNLQVTAENLKRSEENLRVIETNLKVVDYERLKALKEAEFYRMRMQTAEDELRNHNTHPT